MEDIKEKVDIDNYKDKRMYLRFINEKNPGMCVTGKFNITNLYRLSKKGHKLNALLCYAIMLAGQKNDKFHYSIKKDGLYYYKNVKTNAVVKGIDGQLYYADYKYADNFLDFEKEYIRVNEYCINNCVNHIVDAGALLATSAMLQFPFESFASSLSDIFWDNFLMWGAYKKHLFKVELNITLRFHHATIAGQDAANFFKTLQEEMNNIKLD